MRRVKVLQWTAWAAPSFINTPKDQDKALPPTVCSYLQHSITLIEPTISLARCIILTTTRVSKNAVFVCFATDLNWPDSDYKLSIFELKRRANGAFSEVYSGILSEGTTTRVCASLAVHLYLCLLILT